MKNENREENNNYRTDKWENLREGQERKKTEIKRT